MQTVQNNIQNNPQFGQELTEFLRKYATETNVCQRQGRCALGCIPGARHTLNKVIYQAVESKGEHIEVRPLCEAYDIEPLKPGTNTSTSSANANDYLYRIYYLQTTADSVQDTISVDNGDLTVQYRFSKQTDKEKSIICKELFVSAGSIGSTELLLKSVNSPRQSGDKLILSPRLGKGFSTNGDLLGIVHPTKNNVATSRGPIVTSAIRFRDENQKLVYTIEDSGVPKMIEPLLYLMLRTTDDFNNILDNNSERQIANWISTRVKAFRMFIVEQSLEGLRDFTKNMATIKTWNDVLRGIKMPSLGFPLLPNQPLTDVVLLSGMGNDSSDGEIKLADSWNPKSPNAIDITFDLNNQKQLFTQMINSMKGIAEDMGLHGPNGLLIPLYDPDNTARNNTVVVHPLGGCSIGNDRSKGVVNDLGQVFRGEGSNDRNPYPGLYVVDGAIVPTALGVNSSLTIAALAFRIAKECTQDDIQNPKYLPVEAFTVNNEIRYMAK
jgi:cholesterol oxidase